MTGAERAEARAKDGAVQNHADWLGPAEPEAPAEVEIALPEEQPVRPRGTGPRLLGAFLILVALAWIGAVGWLLWQSRPAPTLQNAVTWIGTLSGPLVLLGLLWLLLGRSARRETERFTRAVEEMRRESNALESVLEIVAARIEANHARLRGEAEKLMSLGDEASDRLGRVTYYLSKETASLDRKAAELESAAAAAKVDIGVLMHDLPRAEEQARAVTEAMKEAGLTAHGQASALEAQLAALGAKGREADEVLGGAAQRMAAHVARIESTAGAAAASLDEVAAGMTGAVDAAMARAAEAVEAARSALETQGCATLATIEQSRAALDKAGDEAARSLAARLDLVSDKIETLAGHLSAQDAASQALVTGLAKELADLDSALERIGETGGRETEKLGAAVAGVRDGTRELMDDLAGGRDRFGELIDRARLMGETLAAVASRLDGEVPSALAEVETRAARTTEAVSALSPLVGGIQDQARDVEERMSAVGGRVEAIAGLVAEQDRTSRALVERLVADVAHLEASFASVEATGGARAETLAGAIGALREAATALETELGAGDARAEALAERARALGEALETLPAALAAVEAGTERTRDSAAALAPAVEALRASAEAAAGHIGDAESSLGRQREALDSLLSRIEEGSAGAEERLRALGEAASEAQQAAGRIAAETGPELIEALLRVREAASQAAERAREAISTVIPASAAALGEAGREALARAVEETVGAQMDELAALAEHSVDTAKRASERLTRQMLKLGETTAAIEERIDEERRAREEKDADTFSRRVALLIESLNSTAIDVTKILSNEVTDNAWAAYLKGDRGVFTRRAVRLLDTGEAREIARHYEEELEFRDQVNRYIHDFEAMLRRVLADREGSVLGVTILSSDMGKLYVALAQAIERLR
ncbi:MAG: hypothetical protein QOG84_2249 [Sphingomonadales bacterium]|jgi:chromosome segregation ATPase|nr:hypothetical protein [Sphingomonadales bacterium]